MNESVLTVDLFEAMLARSEGRPYTINRNYNRTEVETWTKTTTNTLVEDEQFAIDLTNYMQNRWRLGRKKVTLEEVKSLLDNKRQIISLYRIDKTTNSGYVEDYHDGSRWEGDYNPSGAYREIKRHALWDVIDEFLEACPGRVRFETTEEWTKKS